MEGTTREKSEAKSAADGNLQAIKFSEATKKPIQNSALVRRGDVCVCVSVTMLSVRYRHTHTQDVGGCMKLLRL